MYRKIIISLCKGRNTLIFCQDICTTNCNIFRPVNPGGHRALSTSYALCSEVENENESPSHKVEKRKEQQESLGKTGKEKLLSLLGNMKVEVTTKRRPKLMKVGSVQKKVGPHPGKIDSTISMFQEATAAEAKQPERETLNPTLVAAASAAAACLPDSSRAESELLQQLRQHEAMAQAQAHRRTDSSSLGNIIANMKVGRRPAPTQQASRCALKDDEDEDEGATRRPSHSRAMTSGPDGERRRRSHLVGKRLNIFTKKVEQDITTAPTLSLWDLEMANAIAAATNKPPRNGFEEMIEWMKEGKLWKFPIDNEAGLEEEALVPFHEHVFLEHHLEEGFPQRGPVRHFMELVVTGLSKNPHLTASQKVQHISWFRDYFRSKEELLTEAGAIKN